MIVLLFLLNFVNLAYGWEDSVFAEDATFQYWTGISSPRDNMSESLSEAYDNAINEAIKYNYGFKQKITESSFQNLKEIDLYKENHIEMPTIQLNGVLPFKQKTIQDNNKKFISFRQIRYQKSSIIEEKNRLNNQHITIINNQANLIIENNQGNKLGKILISTNPTNSEIKLTPQKIVTGNKDFYLSSNNTEFVIPFGTYILNIEKNGYKPIERTILVAGESQSLLINLESEDSWLDLNVTPKDAIIKIDGNKIYTLKKIKMAPNKTINIHISHPDYFEESFSTSVLSNDYKVITKELQPKKSSFRITSNPSDANVFANGVLIGKTPILSYSSQSKSIEFVIVKKGFKPQNLSLNNIKPNEIIEPINFELVNY